MAGGGEGRTLEETSTWAVAVVCLVLVIISVIIERVIHLIGQWLKNRNRWALYEALEKVKSELMLLGFISLLLTVGQSSISKICVPAGVADSWHPCTAAEEDSIIRHGSSPGEPAAGAHRRRLLLAAVADAVGEDAVRRGLGGGGGGSSADKCTAEGKAPFISTQGINQLHIFIFVLAVSHILYCICTMALGRLKMRSWKAWEFEAKTPEYQLSHDAARFRFARETSFGRRHLNFWSKSPVLIWIVCFLRQFGNSVHKVDYLTLRHGFIAAHLAPHSSSKFNFHKYINRSLEQDFKVVVGISPAIWFIAVLFLLLNTHGWQSYLWLPFVPLLVILMVGAKLQVIITKMGIQIMERGDVVRGVPVVRPRDKLFWFNRPGLLLFLIHCILFQNAFQLAFLAWSWYEFGYPSCFHKRIEDIIIRISMGILIQILCSYVTLPLYALVTQMGSQMKPTIFNDRVAGALRKWHHTAKQRLKENRSRHGSTSAAATPSASRPGTPRSHLSSPVHLLQHYRSEVDSRYVAYDDDDDEEEDRRPAAELVPMSSLPSPSTVSPRHREIVEEVDCSSSSSRYQKSATLRELAVAEREMREVDADGRRPEISIDFSFVKAQR